MQITFTYMYLFWRNKNSDYLEILTKQSRAGYNVLAFP